MNDATLRLLVGIAIETVRETSPVVRCLGPAASAGFASQALAAVGVIPSLADAASPPLAEVAAIGVSDIVHPPEAAREDIAWAREHSVPWVLSVAGDAHASGLLDLEPSIVAGAATSAVSLIPGTPNVIRADGRELRFDLPVTDLSRAFGVDMLVPALTAACAAVAGPVEAAVAASAWVALAGERAAEHARGPASLRAALIDELALLGGDEVSERVFLS